MLSTIHARAETPAPTHRPVLPGRIDPCPSQARLLIARSIAADLPSRVMQQLDEDAREGRHPGCRVDSAVAAIITQLGKVFLATGESGRLPNPHELLAFHVFGGRAGLRGPECHEVLETLDAAAEAIHTLVLADATRHDGAVGVEAALEVCASLCGVIETVSRLAFDEVVRGFEAARAWVPYDVATRRLFSDLLDGPAWLVGTLTSLAECDVQVPRAVALLCHRRTDPSVDLWPALQEIEALVPHAVGVSSASTRPAHERVVIEYRSRELWRRGRALIRAVADVRGLRLVTTDPVLGLGRLRDRYRAISDALAVVGGGLPAGDSASTPGAVPRDERATASAAAVA
jgi:hypothetical protein